MLPMVTQDAVAVCFLFDLTAPASLGAVKQWYRDVRALNRSALVYLVGAKHDVFAAQPAAQQAAVLDKARHYAAAMKAPLVLTSAASGLNVALRFKLVFEQAFGLDMTVARSATVEL